MGHRVARSTIAGILKANGIPPSGERPTTWRTFLRAHWPALVAADFFTTEVWTARGLVTYYTVFIIELQSRRVHVAGSTRYPDETFVVQAMRGLSNAIDGIVSGRSVLIDPAMSHNWIDAISWTSRVALFQLVVVAVCGWLHREQSDLIAFLREENRVLKSRLETIKALRTN